MDARQLVKTWFECWETERYQDLPISENFKHISPYGSIQGKKSYIDLVEANLDRFLGHQFIFQDAVYEEEKACVRYKAVKESFGLEVTEWHYVRNGRIQKIVAYYNLGNEIGPDQALNKPD